MRPGPARARQQEQGLLAQQGDSRQGLRRASGRFRRGRRRGRFGRNVEFDRLPGPQHGPRRSRARCVPDGQRRPGSCSGPAPTRRVRRRPAEPRGSPARPASRVTPAPASPGGARRFHHQRAIGAADENPAGEKDVQRLPGAPRGGNTARGRRSPRVVTLDAPRPNDRAEPHRGRHHPGAHAQSPPGDPGRCGSGAAGRGIPADGGFGAEKIEGAAAAGRNAADALDLGEHGVEGPHRGGALEPLPGWRSGRTPRQTGFPRVVCARSSASRTSTTPKAPAGSRSTGEGEPTEETQAKYAPPLSAPASRSLKTKRPARHDQLTRASATRPR